jgi:glycosyltransferase involved in cell wall biosynthesis
MKKIAVNTRLLRSNKMDGIGWFAFNTLDNIVKRNPDIEFHFFFDSGIDESFLFGPNIVPHNLFPPAKHSLLNIIWSEVSVKKALKKIQPDLYFSPDGMLCLGWSGKQHAVIHDINFMHNPEYLKYSNRKYYRHFFPKFANKAARIATLSQYSKDDICETMKVPPEKVDIVYCGINSYLKPMPVNQVDEVRKKYAGGNPYFLFVGTLSPRKNVLGLLKAFEKYKTGSFSDTKLLIVGGGMYKDGELYDFQKEMIHGKDVIFTGRMSNEDINLLYGAALALTFVPFFEGFGIPLVEAMHCEIPIIASNVTSLPEVTGDAALLVDPSSIEEISAAMSAISGSPALRNELIAKGRERKKLFSWERTSDLLWQSLSQCL